MRIQLFRHLTEPLPDQAEAESSSPLLLWAFWLMWLPFLIQPGIALVQSRPSPWKVASISGFALFVVLYLWLTWREAYRLTRSHPGRIPREQLWWVSIIVVLGVTLCFIQGAWGLGAFIFISAGVAGRVTFRQGIVVFGGLSLLTLIMGVFIAAPWPSIALMCFLVLVVGATTATFNRAMRTNRELRLARREIARLAITEERLRFARDLHDLLGHSLSLITLKSELLGQLIADEPEAALREARDIEAAARTALREVREAVAGYRQTTLANELQRAQELLTAAAIQSTMPTDVSGLPTAVETLLTWVAREGVTNVIRHSRATHCTIALTRQPGAIHMSVTDDGRGAQPDLYATAGQAPVAGQPGNGLRGIAERVAALDGRFAAGPAEDQGFRLAVTLPLAPERGKRPPSLQPAHPTDQPIPDSADPFPARSLLPAPSGGGAGGGGAHPAHVKGLAS